MALPASGQISLNDVNVELGNSGTAQIDMNSAAVRGLFGVASGQISMSDGYGKANTFSFTISSNVQEGNLSTLATAAGWDGSTAVNVTINSGVYLWSNNTANPGLLINIANCALINNGYILGKGGNGGQGQYQGSPVGIAGNRALNITTTGVTVTNNSGAYIAGGGGGGSGNGPSGAGGTPGGGGGAGGATGGLGSNGDGGGQFNRNPATAPNTAAPGGATAGGSGGGWVNDRFGWNGSGSGFIVPGSSHKEDNGGAGGAGGVAGSNGGSAGSGGGGWGAAGGNTFWSGGAAGAAITSSYSYTLTNSGTIYGAT